MKILNMKIGILKEERVPFDNRTPLTPIQCRELLTIYPTLEIVVKRSSERCFNNNSYTENGLKVTDDLSDCDILLGIKEVPVEKLIKNKTYFFFSHTIKKQKQNRELLQKMLELSITMIDFECMNDKKGKRLLGFGRYAGIVGAYHGLLTYGVKFKKYLLKAPNICSDKRELEDELENIRLTNEKIILTGTGRVSSGALEILRKSGIKEVSKEEFLNHTFGEGVFLNLKTMDYNVRKDGLSSAKQEFYDHPELYTSSFMNFAKHADIFIAGHYYSNDSPFLFTRDDARSTDFNIKVVADISCDIDGSLASTIRASTHAKPTYGYNPITEKEDNFMIEDVIAVMAVDNLPSLLPKDASEDFGKNLIEKVFPLFMIKDKDKIIKNATICSEGELKDQFLYLQDFVNGF